MSAAPASGAAARLHAVVLAAGASGRFGSPKQLISIGGRPLLREIVARAAALVGAHVTVVLGASADALESLLGDSSATVVLNSDWREGISSSIRSGIARLPPECDAVLLLLADQAAVTIEDLRRLDAAWRARPDRLAAAAYSATLGVPAIFPRARFAQLLALRGDRGAKAILDSAREQLTAVPMENAALDIDTPADLEKLRR